MDTIENLQAKLNALQAKTQEYCHALEAELAIIVSRYVAREIAYSVSVSVGTNVYVKIKMEDETKNDASMNLDYNAEKDEIEYRNVCNGSYTLSHPFAIHKLRLALCLTSHDAEMRNLFKDALAEMKPTLDEYYDTNVELCEARRERDDRLMYETINSFQVGDYYMAGDNESWATLYLIKKVTPKQVKVEISHMNTGIGSTKRWYKASLIKAVSKEELANNIVRGTFRKTTKPVDLP